jgi:hypothetical protein
MRPGEPLYEFCHARNMGFKALVSKPAAGKALEPIDMLDGLEGTHERELTKCRRTGSCRVRGFDEARLRPMGDLDA